MKQLLITIQVNLLLLKDDLNTANAMTVLYDLLKNEWSMILLK